MVLCQSQSGAVDEILTKRFCFLWVSSILQQSFSIGATQGDPRAAPTEGHTGSSPQGQPQARRKPIKFESSESWPADRVQKCQVLVTLQGHERLFQQLQSHKASRQRGHVSKSWGSSVAVKTVFEKAW